MRTTQEKKERFILKLEAGVKFQGMVVYKTTKADGKIEIKDCHGKDITDKNILDNFDKLAIPYGCFINASKAPFHRGLFQYD